MGIEPTSLAWKAKVLPLNYARIFSSGREDRIWTCDLLVPNQALYQAKLLPAVCKVKSEVFTLVYYSIVFFRTQAFFKQKNKKRGCPKT